MQYREQIQGWLKEHEETLLSDLAAIVSIRSVKGENVPDAPFGTEPARALGWMLEKCREYGLLTENVDNYAGSADLNEAEPTLGILAHLDVVPEGEGWTHDPFTLTFEEESGKLIGRGTSDDKGPAIAALYALRAVKELGIPLKSGVRLIFGTDEENGSSDLAYYMQKKTLPPMVFTPDGDYPVITLEKGMIRLKLTAGFTDGLSEIASLSAGAAVNAVPAYAEAVLKNGERLTVIGTNAHASTPELGDNALTKLLAAVKEQASDGQQAKCICKLSELFPHGETNGTSCGIAASDELSGGLTCVLSKMEMDFSHMTAWVDIRFPVCCKGVDIVQRMQEALAPIRCEAALCDEPHHTDESSVFVQTLLHVYEEVTGEPGECLAIGGGTYVHHIEGGVAFGATFPGTDVHMHGADEFILKKHLLLDAEMMALAIVALCG